MVELNGHYMHNGVKEKIYAGGMFRMNEVEDLKNLYPLNVVDVVSHRVQIRYIKTGQVLIRKLLNPERSARAGNQLRWS